MYHKGEELLIHDTYEIEAVILTTTLCSLHMLHAPVRRPNNLIDPKKSSFLT